MRLEITLNFDTRALEVENRSFKYILRTAIMPVARSWLHTPEQYHEMIVLFDLGVFPGVVFAYTSMFDAILDRFQKIFNSKHRAGLMIGESEIVSNIERLALYTLTGDPRVSSAGLEFPKD